MAYIDGSNVYWAFQDNTLAFNDFGGTDATIVEHDITDVAQAIKDKAPGHTQLIPTKGAINITTQCDGQQQHWKVKSISDDYIIDSYRITDKNLAAQYLNGVGQSSGPVDVIKSLQNWKNWEVGVLAKGAKDGWDNGEDAAKDKLMALDAPSKQELEKQVDDIIQNDWFATAVPFLKKVSDQDNELHNLPPTDPKSLLDTLEKRIAINFDQPSTQPAPTTQN